MATYDLEIISPVTGSFWRFFSFVAAAACASVPDMIAVQE